MHHFPTALILITALLLAGCFERSPDLESPKIYNSEQITFQYPGNWKVSMDSGIGHLTLETPGDAIVIVQTHPAEPQLELEKLAKAFSEEFLKETPIGEMKVDSFTEQENELGYQRFLEKFSISLLGESIDHHRIYAGKETELHDLFLIFQSPSEDFEKTKPGFDLILKTL